MTDLVLNIQDLSIGYSKTICTDINAQVNRGELIGLTGKNGSGKSTLIKTILGLQSELSGSILIHNENAKHWSVQKRAKNIAVVFSRLSQVPAIPVFDLIALGRLPYGNGLGKLKSESLDLIENALELVGIQHLSKRFATQLSDGQLQMVMIARALVQDTQLVIMDEPTSHLDIENQFKIFELIYKLSNETQKTFIVASHQIELVLQNATQLWWMNEGQFYAGYPEQVAYEQEIYEKLSQEKIKFDYQAGHFHFQHSKLRKVKLTNDNSDLAYWTKHALERSGFEIVSEAEIEVQIDKNKIQLNNHNFESIGSLIQFLQSN